MNFSLPQNKKIYFASDLHLTMTSDESNRCRERDFIKWLDTIKTDAAAIFLLGDMFDFWFEYRYVVPRGFVRLFGKFAELTDNGISIHYFTGNHDQWMKNYLSSEMNVTVHNKPEEFEIDGKLFFIGHGNDFGLEGFAYHLLHHLFGNRFLRVLYASLHPRWGIFLGKNWSISHSKRFGRIKPFDGHEKELIFRNIQKILLEKHYDFFVFGHRHLAMDLELNENSRYINTGEWLETQSYAVFDGKNIRLYSAKENKFCCSSENIMLSLPTLFL